MRKTPLTLLAYGIAVLNAGTAQAQPAQTPAGPPNGSPHGVVAVGSGVVPELDGSGDMRVLPLVQ